MWKVIVNKALLTLEVVGVDGMILIVNEVSSINVRLENGMLLGLRPGHAPLIGTIVKSPISFKKDENWDTAEIDSGILTVEKNTVRILTSGI